ncbi:hypothetical protein LCGC14_1575910 [marine sediment metagenome]|uniref:Aldehyde ferredoxin oxidoreductase N-terminal domain-containing protein n=1 Tax=marine sediment metagenome TaxID=412755 RepID=A0A0F9IIA4_9ZZZZ|nr:aldehyde ferredoxin oxidoreductase [Desulfobacterales bacterium]
MKGWCGKLLRVNLTKVATSVEEIDQRMMRDYLGGRGLGARYLYNEIDPQIDPLSKENKLIFAAGPVTGTTALAASRYEVVTKAPLTGTIGGANSAGFWGPELKFAGYDMIIFEGISDEPVYLWIDNEKAEIRSAIHLWGEDTFTTQKKIWEETNKKARVACIGPAGEKLVKFACIINDNGRAAGRGGVGAVMGSKKLKAIAVRGTNRVPVADKDYLSNVVKKAWAELPKPQKLTEYGTAYVLEFVNAIGALPTRNWQAGIFEGADKIGAEAVKRILLKKAACCFSCPMACGRETEVNESGFDGKGPGAEYEGLASLGSACGIDNLAAIMKAYYICNELGMDVMSAGYTVALAMEMAEKGYLPEEDVGLKLNFGNAPAMVELVRKMGNREGFGNILAEGSYILAERYGHLELSVTVKKQEPAAYDPRGMQGIGLAYATSTRGACHMRSQMEDIDGFAMTNNPALFGLPLGSQDRLATTGKAAYLIVMENDKAVIDSMGICAFMSAYKMGLEYVLTVLAAVTGVSYGVCNYLKTGERIWNLERLFNLKAGFTAKDDTLPKRFLEEPLAEGPSKGNVCKLEKMKQEYYQLRGWDDQGVPTEKKLRELGLINS